MALGGTKQSAPQLAPINPANLIGQADPSIVEPRATAILTDAFRQGVVTADDIMSRIGEGAQAKKKAELQMAQEFTSPEAQAARAQQLATQTSQGQLVQAQSERATVIAQYPAVEYFDKLAAKAGIAEPKLPDGTPDYKEMEKIGLELALDTSKKLTAADERKNIDAQFDNDNQVVRAFTKQGAPVDASRVRELDRIINTPFSRQAPGSMVTASTPATVAPVVEARGTAAAPLEDLTVLRTRLANKLGPDVVAGMGEEDLRQLDAGQEAELAPPVSNVSMVVPRGTPTDAPAAAAPARGAAPTGALPFGTPTAGGYAMGGTPKAPTVKTTTAEQDKAKLALGRFAESATMQQFLANKQYDPTTLLSEINRFLPQILKSGDRKLFEAATESWAQGLLRLESGAAISVPEQAWYSKTFFPQVGDPAEVTQAKARLRANVERGVSEIAQKGGSISIEDVKNTATLSPSWAAAGGTLPPGGGSAAGNELPLPSGKTLVRDANGIYSYK